MTSLGSSDPFLITGATGFIGRYLVENIHQPLRAAVRREIPLPVPSCLIGDLRDNPEWRTALQGARGVIHCAGLAADGDVDAEDLHHINVQATIDLARQAAEAGASRFIFLSTALIDIQPRTRYAESKLLAEEALRQIPGLELVIIRPPIVVGRGAKGNLGTLAKVMRSGLPLPLGLANQNSRDVVSRETLARLISACMTEPIAVGKTLYPTDGRVSTRELAERLGVEEGLTPRFLPVPKALLIVALSALGKRAMIAQLFGDSTVDGREAARVMTTWSDHADARVASAFSEQASGPDVETQPRETAGSR